MKQGIYNKWVRDKMPEIIRNSGKECDVKTLSDEEYLQVVDAKLDEELAEYHEEQTLEELVGLLEVLYAATNARGYSVEELEAWCLKKKEEDLKRKFYCKMRGNE